MLKYKLTDQNNETYNNTVWGENVTHEVEGGDLMNCGPGWLHFFPSLEIAVLLNGATARIENPKLWTCLPEGKVVDFYGGLKGACTKLTTIKEIPLPVIKEKHIGSIFRLARENRYLSKEDFPLYYYYEDKPFEFAFHLWWSTYSKGVWPCDRYADVTEQFARMINNGASVQNIQNIIEECLKSDQEK